MGIGAILPEQSYGARSNSSSQKDWRDMSNDAWNKMIENFDEYVDDYKERLRLMKEMQLKASVKAAGQAAAAMKATAAARASLMVAATGNSQSGTIESPAEEDSWTYDLQTDDRAILATAEIADDAADTMLSAARQIESSFIPPVSRDWLLFSRK